MTDGASGVASDGEQTPDEDDQEIIKATPNAAKSE